MKVFLSWSGDRSKAIAEIMRKWLPSVLQVVRPYFSPDDVSKGSRWSSEIAKELEASRIALLFITPENPEAPWLVFEAGALSKNLDRSKVCPLLFGEIEPTDIKGPLVQFQAAKFGKEEMRRVLKMINTELGDAGLSPEVLESVFEMWWPKLEEKVTLQLRETAEAGANARRSDRDMLEEILSLSRRTLRVGREDSLDVNHPAFRDLLKGIIDICSLAQEHLPESEFMQATTRLLGPLEYFLRGRRRMGSRGDVAIERMLENLRALCEPDLQPITISAETEAEKA
jgi:hypothetical protein